MVATMPFTAAPNHQKTLTYRTQLSNAYDRQDEL